MNNTTFQSKAMHCMITAAMAIWMFVMSGGQAQAAETLAVKFTTPTLSGSQTYIAVWLTDKTTGNYIATLGYRGNINKTPAGNNYWTQLGDFWNTPTGIGGVDGGTNNKALRPLGIDASMGATAGSGGTFDWTSTPTDVSSLADKTYTIRFGIVRHNNNRSYISYDWVKDGASLSITNFNMGDSWTLNTLTYTGRSSYTLAKNSADSQTATVNTNVGAPPSVKVANGAAPVAGVAIKFHIATGSGKINGGTTDVTVNTDASGIAALTSWTLGTGAGTNNNTVTATPTVATTSPTSVTFTATATAGTATQMAIKAGNNQTATVNATVTTAPSVIVKDVHNNPKAGVSVTFAVASGGGSITGTNPVTTNAAGIAAIGSWKLGTASGANTLTASATGLATVTFSATGNAGPATSMAITAGCNNQTATISTDVSVDPSVTLTDTYGNPVANAQVTFAVATGGGTIAGSPATSNASGIAALTSWTLGATAGANTLTVTRSGLPTLTITATGILPTGNYLAINGGNTQTATVDTSVAIAPSVIVTDAGGAPVPGIAITFTVNSGGGSIIGGSATTGANGIATLTSWKLGQVAGANQLRATGAGLLNSPRTFTATGTAGAAFSVAVNAGDDQTATVGTAVATKPSVIVKDAFNNVKSGVSVTFAAASGNGVVTSGTQTTNSSGIATVGNWTLNTVPGTNTLTATVAGLTPVAFTATAVVGSASLITKSAGDGQSAVVGKTLTTDPQVRITDAQNNPFSNIDVTFTVLSGGGRITSGTTTTDGGGYATVGSWTLGTTSGANTLRAQAGSLSTTFTATGTVGPAAMLAISAGDEQTAAASTAVTIAPAVLVTDTYGNPVAGVVVTFAIESGGGSVTAATPTTDASGIATVGSWTLGSGAGMNTLTARAAGLPDSTVTFTATATVDASTSPFVLSFKTTTHGGLYAPTNVVAVWIERLDGTFVKTIGDWSGERRSSLTGWIAKAGSGDADAVMGATRSDHNATLTLTWDLIPRGGGVPVADGNYRLCFEVAENEGGGGASRPATEFTVAGGAVAPIGPLTLTGVRDVNINKSGTEVPLEEPGGCGLGSAHALFGMLFLLLGLRLRRLR